MVLRGAKPAVAFQTPKSCNIFAFNPFTKQRKKDVSVHRDASSIALFGDWKIQQRRRPENCLTTEASCQTPMKIASRLVIIAFSVAFCFGMHPNRASASSFSGTASYQPSHYPNTQSQREISLISRATTVTEPKSIPSAETEGLSPQSDTRINQWLSSASNFLHSKAGKASLALASILAIWRVLAAVRSELKLRFLLSEFLSSDFFKIFDFWKVPPSSSPRAAGARPPLPPPPQQQGGPPTPTPPRADRAPRATRKRKRGGERK